MTNNRLVDTFTQLRVQGILSEVDSQSPSFFPSQHATQVTALNAKYPTVFQPHLSTHTVEHDITHHIHINGHLINARPRRLNLENLTAARQEFEHML